MQCKRLTALAAVFTSSAVASADIIRVEVAGAVTRGFGDIAVGDAVSATFEYDTSAFAPFPDPESTRYTSGGSLITFTVGDFDYASSASAPQYVTNRSFGDSYGVEWLSVTGSAQGDPSTGRWSPGELSLFFEGPADALDSTDLPTVEEFLSLDSRRYGHIVFGPTAVQFDLTSATARVIPLPPAAWVGLAGLGLVAGAGRMRKVNRRSSDATH